MIIELIQANGRGAVRLEASQVLVRGVSGVPLMVAAEYGPRGAYCAAHSGDKDFNRVLRALGIHELVVCDTLQMPAPPPGARLLAGPAPEKD